MAKLVLALALAFLGTSQVLAKSLELELYAQTSLPKNAVLSKTKIGGLSGIQWTGTKLVAVSDDRGKFGTPRYYDFDLKFTEAKTPEGKVELKALKSYPVKFPGVSWVYDLESIIVLPSGNILLSTEGDNNTKPRSMPGIFEMSSEGKLKLELPLPDKFLPERLGRQTKGIENNRGFEGITLSSDGQHLYAMNEAPTVTESLTPDCNSSWVRIVDFLKDSGDENYKPVAEYAYLIDKLHHLESGPEVYRGVSEILFFEPQKLLVLERGARLSKKGIGYTASIYSYDFSGLKDVSRVPSLCISSQVSGKKELLVDLSQVLKSENVENFEGLSWGPTLPDGRRSLLVISDNNFSSREKTQLLVFAVKEVP